MRASDGEREDTVTRLRHATTEGRLTLEELAERVGAADGARDREELAALLADLPPPAVAPVPVAGPVELRRVVLRRMVRRGRFALASRTRIVAILGSLELDLRDAVIREADPQLEIATVFGTVTLLVPEGVGVALSGEALGGTVESHLVPPVAPGAPILRIRRGGLGGKVTIRARTRREHLRGG